MGLQRKTNIELLNKHTKWKRIATLVNDNEADIVDQFCIRLPNESKKAWLERKNHFVFHFVNNVQDLISAQTKAIFRQGVRIDNDDNLNNSTKNKDSKDSLLQPFLDNVLNGSKKIPFEEYLRTHIADNLKAYGTIFIVIDKPGIDANNLLEEKEINKAYLTIIEPLDVVDFFYDDKDELVFFKYVSEKLLYDEQTKEHTVKEIFCTWTINEYIEQDNDKIYKKVDHGYGLVPVIIKPLYLAKAGKTIGSSSMEQTSRFIITGGTLLHLACYELYKHGSSLLMLHEDARTGANRDIDLEGNTKLKKQDSDSVLEWSGEQIPQYLLKELEVENLLILADKYYKLAEENEKTQKSVSKMGAKGQNVAESGFSKIIERAPIENNLIALASCVEDIARQILNLVAEINSIDNDIIIEFYKDFDVRTITELYKDLELAVKNNLDKVSITAYKTIHKKIIDKQITDVETKQQIMEEIDNYILEEPLDTFDKSIFTDKDE